MALKGNPLLPHSSPWLPCTTQASWAAWSRATVVLFFAKISERNRRSH